MTVSVSSIRHTPTTLFTSFNGGIGLPALMALMGHVTPEMTLRYARLASPTIRTAYQQAMEKIRAGQALPLVAMTPAPPVPDRVEWLHAEMVKTRVAHGYCSRHLAAEPLHAVGDDRLADRGDRQAEAAAGFANGLLVGGPDGG